MVEIIAKRLEDKTRIEFRATGSSKDLLEEMLCSVSAIVQAVQRMSEDSRDAFWAAFPEAIEEGRKGA